MSNTITITIKSSEKEYKVTLRKPLFNEYRMASIMLQTQDGHVDKLGCGSSLVQHCWEKGDEELKKGDETKNPDLATAYASLCIEAYDSLYTGFETDVKKN
jgi:hypothetical protein